MIVEGITQSLITGAGLFWKAFWALALGYAFSSLIQVFIPKSFAAKKLSKGTPKQLSIAALLGFISSSCSFAALSGTRGLFSKGASLTTALAYMFASTNLAIEVAILAYIFLGWQYSLALFVGAPIIIAIQSILVRFTYPKHLVEKARQNIAIDSHNHDPSQDLPSNFKKKIQNSKTWIRVASTYRAEWKMVYKEIFIGFLVAGFVATLIPTSFYESLFLQQQPFALPLQALMAPVLAIITIIGSMGNGPLAAVLANNGVLFGAIMAFLYADFNVPPAIKINAKYYGWKFALYLAAITALAAILTGMVVHFLFGLLGILPLAAKDLTELATFRIDYTFWLNLFALAIAGVLFFQSRPMKHH